MTVTLYDKRSLAVKRAIRLDRKYPSAMFFADDLGEGVGRLRYFVRCRMTAATVEGFAEMPDLQNIEILDAEGNVVGAKAEPVANDASAAPAKTPRKRAAKATEAAAKPKKAAKAAKPKKEAAPKKAAKVAKPKKAPAANGDRPQFREGTKRAAIHAMLLKGLDMDNATAATGWNKPTVSSEIFIIAKLLGKSVAHDKKGRYTYA